MRDYAWYTYIYLHICTYTYIYLHIPTYICIYLLIVTYSYIYLHIPAFWYTYLYLHILTYIYIYLHMPIYTYIQGSATCGSRAACGSIEVKMRLSSSMRKYFVILFSKLIANIILQNNFKQDKKIQQRTVRMSHLEFMLVRQTFVDRFYSLPENIWATLEQKILCTWKILKSPEKLKWNRN